MQTSVNTGMSRVDALLASALLKAESRATAILAENRDREAEKRHIRDAQLAEQARQEKLYEARLEKSLNLARRGLRSIATFAQCEAIQKLIPFQMGRYRRIDGQVKLRPEFIFYEAAVCRRRAEDSWSPADTMVRIIFIQEQIVFEFESEEGWDQEPEELPFAAPPGQITEFLRRLLTRQNKENYRIKNDPLLWGSSAKPFLSQNPYFYARDLVGKILMDCADPQKFEAYCLAALETR